MKKNNNNSLKKVYDKNMSFFIIGGIFLGVVLGTILIYLLKGDFRYEGLIVTFVTSMILAGVEIIRRKLRKHNIPEADER